MHGQKWKWKGNSWQHDSDRSSTAIRYKAQENVTLKLNPRKSTKLMGTNAFEWRKRSGK